MPHAMKNAIFIRSKIRTALCNAGFLSTFSIGRVILKRPMPTGWVKTYFIFLKSGSSSKTPLIINKSEGVYPALFVIDLEAPEKSNSFPIFLSFSNDYR